MAEVYMPKFGLTMKEGTIGVWHKREGEPVTMGEPLVEVTSEKITNEVEAPASGVLDKILVQEGETAAVGSVIGLITEIHGRDEENSRRAGTPSVSQPEAEETTGRSKVVPLTGARKVIAERMRESLRRSPQATMTTNADMSALIALKEAYADRGLKVTFTDLLVKIVARALKEHPVLNSSLQDDQLITYDSINIGVAVAGEDALFVPVIKNAGEMSLQQISQQIKKLSEKVRSNRLGPDDLTGGTFTISNMGMYDVDVMTPIINIPEAAILSVGTIRKELVVEADDSIRIKPMATLSLTIDHAVMDGAPAARFLAALKVMIANPRDYLE